jgi:hypothetical protein
MAKEPAQNVNIASDLNRLPGQQLSLFGQTSVIKAF